MPVLAAISSIAVAATGKELKGEALFAVHPLDVGAQAATGKELKVEISISAACLATMFCSPQQLGKN
jgi:hypothetical protein